MERNKRGIQNLKEIEGVNKMMPHRPTLRSLMLTSLTQIAQSGNFACPQNIRRHCKRV